mgnify:CR=1 FL=1
MFVFHKQGEEDYRIGYYVQTDFQEVGKCGDVASASCLVNYLNGGDPIGNYDWIKARLH